MQRFGIVILTINQPFFDPRYQELLANTYFFSSEVLAYSCFWLSSAPKHLHHINPNINVEQEAGRVRVVVIATLQTSDMPRATRATTRRTAQSTAPYPTRTVSTSSQTANLAVVAPPPVMSWDHMAQTPYYLDAQMQGQLDEYNQHVLASYHTGLPTPISGAGPVRPLSAPLQMSHNTFFGVPTSGARESSSWSDRMDEILIENAGRKKWDQISKQYFNGVKSANACRKRHGRIKEERKDPSKWPAEERERIIDAYRDEASRERMWTPLAEEVGKPWRDVEQLVSSRSLSSVLF